jgi:SAM-dependent methyltransferase
MVVDSLVDHMNRFEGDEPVKIVSLASGSAQAVVEAVQRYGKPAHVKLLDSDPTALEASKKIVEQAGLSDQFEIIKTRIDPRTIRRHCKDFNPGIIEMVGLMDYFNDAWAAKVIDEVKSCLMDGGLYLTCNIAPNPEKLFLDWVLLWPMIYRAPEEWRDILLQGWFAKDEFKRNQIRIIYDPFKIHGLAFCIK